MDYKCVCRLICFILLFSCKKKNVSQKLSVDVFLGENRVAINGNSYTGGVEVVNRWFVEGTSERQEVSFLERGGSYKDFYRFVNGLSRQMVDLHFYFDEDICFQRENLLVAVNVNPKLKHKKFVIISQKDVENQLRIIGKYNRKLPPHTVFHYFFDEQCSFSDTKKILILLGEKGIPFSLHSDKKLQGRGVWMLPCSVP